MIERVQGVHNIAVVLPKNYNGDMLGCSSALVGYLLQLHKKVTLVMPNERLPYCYKDVAWVGSARLLPPAKVELILHFGVQSLEIFNGDVSEKCFNLQQLGSKEFCNYVEPIGWLFIHNQIPINKKMADSLYLALVEATQNFTKLCGDGMSFALAQKLMEYKADHQAVSICLQKNSTLSQLRLTAALLKQMKLRCDGRVAFFYADEKLLQKYGANKSMCSKALQFGATLPTVLVSVLIVEGLSSISTLEYCFADLQLQENITLPTEVDGATQIIEEKIIQEVKKIEKKK